MDEGQANPWDAPADTPPGSEPPTPTEPDAGPQPDEAIGAPAELLAPEAAGPNVPEAGPDADANRNRVVIVALVIFVVILAAGFLLSRHKSGSAKASTDTTTTVAGGTTGGSTPAGSTPQAATITGTTDTFNRADSSTQLGDLPNGSKWTVQTGGWGIQGHQAYLSVPDTKHRNVAWVGTGYPAGEAQVKITKMVPEAGIVFRYSGPCSYWSLESAPAVASWNLFKVEKCKAVSEGNTGYTSVGDGVTIGVLYDATSISVVVNGKVVKTIQNKDLAGAGKVGMVVTGKDAGKVRFTDFIAGGPKGQGIVKPKGSSGNTKPGAGASGSGATTTTKPAGTPTTKG